MKIIICEKSAKPKGKTVTVLGCRVKGTVPTRALMSRCKAAFDYLTENKNSVAVLSGGQGPDEDISEAECMYRILTEKGIDKTRLYIENASTSTEENLKFSSDVIDKNNLSKEIVICTSEYHIYRALMIAKKAGINATGLPAHSMRIFRIPAFTREVFGVWYLTLKNLT
ncbi:YdcF family protein [uncultured Eubacterium sp.]|uniref:YdcF family protein n=1 Tax=uncultured Eubacterium sp. TaxID=165185 RepID=UPI0025D549C5|nr:YdcF family protein [uncultured Eubacterium sp.]